MKLILSFTLTLSPNPSTWCFINKSLSVISHTPCIFGHFSGYVLHLPDLVETLLSPQGTDSCASLSHGAVSFMGPGAWKCSSIFLVLVASSRSFLPNLKTLFFFPPTLLLCCQPPTLSIRLQCRLHMSRWCPLSPVPEACQAPNRLSISICWRKEENQRIRESEEASPCDVPPLKFAAFLDQTR